MSLISTYQSRKSLFAEKLEDKGVEASATDGLTTLINKIEDIEGGFTEGLLLYAENNIVQKEDTVDLYALLLQDGKPVPNKTVDFIGLYTVIAGKVCHVPSHYRFEKFGQLNATVYLDADHHFKIGSGALFYKDDVEQSSAKVYSVEVNQNTLTVVYMGGTTSTFDVSNYDMSVIESTVNIDIICYASGTTGSDGVASYTYTGVGEGLKEVYAKYGTLVSETYSVYDCIYYDSCATDTHSSYAPQGGTVTFSTDKLVLTRTANGECYVQLSPTVTVYQGKTIRFECDIVDADKNSELKIYQQVNGSFNSSTSATSTTNGTLYVDKAIDSSATMIIFRVMGNNLNTGETCGFRNFKVYPI